MKKATSGRDGAFFMNAFVHLEHYTTGSEVRQPENLRIFRLVFSLAFPAVEAGGNGEITPLFWPYRLHFIDDSRRCNRILKM